MKKILFSLILSSLTCIFVQAQVTSQILDIPTTTVHAIDGSAWSSCVGTSLLTGNVYWVYLDPSLNAVIAKKTPAGVVTTNIFMTGVQSNDNHAEMSLGIDNDGYIHLCGGQHNSSPNYYVSTNPEDITSFTFRGNDTSIGGLEGTEITYQNFFRSNTGTLFVTYRSNIVDDFVTGARAIALGRYDTHTKRWTMIGGTNYAVPTTTQCTPVVGGHHNFTAFVWNFSGVGDMTNLPGKCYNFAHYQGYQLRVRFDQNNGMHVSYNMADSINPGGADVSRFMTHVFYAFSPDEGVTWKKANGQQFSTFPITKAAGDLVYKKYPAGYVYPAVAASQTLTNNSEIMLDKDGAAIVIQVESSGATTYYKWNATSWVNVTSTFTNDNSRLWTNLIRQETYDFGNGTGFKISRDKMLTWLSPITTLTYPTDWYTVVDKYYLQKTGNMRYFARSEANGNAAIVTLVTAAADAVAPIAPTGLASSLILQSTFLLTWTPSADLGVYCYEVYKGGILLTTTANTYVDVTGLTPNTGYSFTIKAKDVAGNLSVLSTALPVTTSIADITKPTTATGLSSSNIAVTSFVLNWSGASTDNIGVTGYEAYNGATLIGSLTGTGNSMTITGLAAGTTFTVTLKAKDDGGNYSNASASISVTTVADVLLTYEGFDVPGTAVGGAAGNTSFGWASASTWSGTAPATALGLTYPGLKTNGKASTIGGSWGPDRSLAVDITSGEVWLSFLADASIDQTKTAVVQFRDISNNDLGRSFGFNTSMNGVSGTWNAVGAVGTVGSNLVVVSYNVSTGVTKYYLNPTQASLGGATPDATALKDTRTLTAGSIRNIRFGSSTGNYLDEIRIGTTWASVTPVALATIPGTPTGLSATAGSTQASVAFTAPVNNGGATILDYTATSSPGSKTATLTQAGSGSITVTGLTNGTAYTFTVTARNSVGSSVASLASNSVTPAAVATIPDAPTIGTATSGNGQATVTFTAPTNNGGATIINYTATSNPGNISRTLTQAGSGTITVTGLTNGTAYTFTVTARNSVGSSSASGASNTVTPAVLLALIAYEGFNGSMNSGTGWGGDWTYLYSNATLTNPGLTFGRLVTAGSKKGSFYELDRSVVSNIGDGESLFVSYIHQETAASSQFKLRSVADGDICISNGTGKLTDNSYSTFDNSHWKGDWTYNGAVLNNVVGRVTFNLIELKRTGASFSFKRWIYTDPTKLPTTMPVDNDANALTYNTWSSTFLGSLNIYGIQLIAAANIYYDEFRFGSTFASVVPLKGIPTAVNNPEVTTPIISRTATGIAVQLNGKSSIELYNANGSLIEKTSTSGMYARSLNNGMYIIRVNGNTIKFVK
ncbi:MAG: BNR-4 repeat-containing protein [Paludibacter sp.]